MNKNEFFKSLASKQTSLASINQFIRQSCEFEIPTLNGVYGTRNNLRGMGLGCSSSIVVNDGNGWNNDVHGDGGDAEVNGVYYNATETSCSPFNATQFKGIKEEFERIMPLYLQASGGMRHSYYSSTHTHTSIGYAGFYGDNSEAGTEGMNEAIIEVPVVESYRNLAMLFTRFLPVFKWLSMTCIRGARGAEGNTYDDLDGDKLYTWYEHVIGNYGSSTGHNPSTDSYMYNMQRESMLRVYRFDVFHFENRMMDCNFSATHMAAWFALNRAASLWAIDMARNGYQFLPTANDILQSKQVAAKHSDGWKYVPKAWIVENWTLLKSYLYKYFKLAGSLDAIEALEKLIDCPIPQYLEENSLRTNYDVTLLENHFSVRLRERDEVLRNKYISAIKTMVVPMAGNLNDFHLNVATYLEVQQKQAVSLYQMLKRENVDIEFMAGRLVYMGE
jgi:hypothetical protein